MAATNSGAAKEAGFLRRNGLSLAMFSLFLVFLLAQTISGHLVHNDDLLEHGQPGISLLQYLATGHFLEATMENWESEFLQMGAYVLMTVGLYQRGSSESKSLTHAEEVDRDPRASRHKPDAPWPVRRGGWVLRVYENSLSIAFILLFLLSFALHLVGGQHTLNETRRLSGELPVTMREFLGSSEFWFQSFQNWQSEFLAMGSMIFLSIWLRQRGSPESKPVDAPHAETGE